MRRTPFQKPVTLNSRPEPAQKTQTVNFLQTEVKSLSPLSVYRGACKIRSAIPIMYSCCSRTTVPLTLHLKASTDDSGPCLFPPARNLNCSQLKNLLHWDNTPQVLLVSQPCYSWNPNELSHTPSNSFENRFS